ncbi:MAG TPA: ABC transporter permease [Tepidimicrobium sp.]|nr:ABC transporter permease [Bacillota bacterium]HHV39717.1 ABC transporter permease [Tepidimicrobium sp.]
MWAFLGRRILYMIPTLVIISIIAFIIIQLPPGDFVTAHIAQMAASGDAVNVELAAALRRQYGLDQPMHVQYYKWITGIFQGNLGYSFEWNQPVRTLIGERLFLTVIVSIASLLFSWIVAFPIGIYSAVRQYSVLDYVFTFIGFLGVSVPGFLIALVLMFFANKYLGLSIGGLFSPEFVNASWSLPRVLDMLQHMVLPMIIIGMSSTTGLIRTMRANLLDELSKPYVETARAKGLNPVRLVLKYPVRIALNPFISTVGFTLPRIISGETIVSVVLSLPTIGPLLLRSLLGQDMYLAGSIILILATLTVIGMLLSDILLAWLDPRVRYE